MNHKQVKIRYLDNRLVEVDEKLVPLLSLIWKHKIQTLLSCQENQPNRAWIHFASTEDATKFINLVAVYPKGPKPWQSLYGRIFGYGSADDWTYNAHLQNHGVEENLRNDEIIERFVGPNDAQFSMSIRFPVSDIELLVTILKKVKG